MLNMAYVLVNVINRVPLKRYTFKSKTLHNEFRSPLWLKNSLYYTRYFLLRFIFVYQKSLRPVFEYKITFWIYNLALWIPKGYCVLKKLVWNVRIKPFWYTKVVKAII